MNNRKYIVVLAVAAAAILIGGSLVRPRPAPKKAEAPAQLPPPSRRGQMRQISEFLAERAEEVATHVIYVPASGSSGVVLESGLVVTAGSSTAAPFSVALERAPQHTVPVRLAPEREFTQTGAWVVIAGRTAQGRPLSGSSTLGGSSEITCGSLPVSKLLLNIPLDEAYAGAGAFNVTGELLGIVGHCGNAWAVIAHPGVMKLLEQQSGAHAVVWREIGLRFAAPDESLAKILRAPGGEGLIVAEVRRGSKAAAAGILPGDVLLRTGSYDLERPGDLLTLGDTISIIRNGKKMELSTEPPFSLEVPDRGLLLTSVKQGSSLFNAGLREGDRILRAGPAQDPSPSDFARLLRREQPLYVVFEREDRRIGALVE